MSRQKGYLAKDNFVLTSWLLLAAQFGRYDFRKLKPLAVALELLDLAVKEHYFVSRRLQKGSRKLHVDADNNLLLITGDYYYARAIILVAPLGDEIVGALAEAIANISAAEVIETDKKTPSKSLFNCNLGKLEKQASLYKTACFLGSYLSGVPTKLSKNLSEVGLFLGAALELSGGECSLKPLKPEIENQLKRHFLAEAKQRLARLPLSLAREEFEQLLCL